MMDLDERLEYAGILIPMFGGSLFLPFVLAIGSAAAWLDGEKNNVRSVKDILVTSVGWTVVIYFCFLDTVVFGNDLPEEDI